MPFLILNISIRKDAHIFGRVHVFGNNAPDMCTRKILIFGHCKVCATFYYVGHVAMGCYVTLL